MKKIILLLSIVILFGCKDDDNIETISDQNVVEAQLNHGLILPAGSFIVDPDIENIEIDDSIDISNDSGAIMPLNVDTNITVNINFNAPNGNIDAIGMRFGTNGPIHFVPINTNGATSGTGSFEFRITPDMCKNLSNICHDIRCFEFAHTTGGQISRSNINQVALTCGNCDEPSCQGILDPKICSIDCDLMQDFQNQQGFYYDAYFEAVSNFNNNPNTQTCNAFYDQWEILVLALLECTDENIYAGQSLIDSIELIREARADGLCNLD